MTAKQKAEQIRISFHRPHLSHPMYGILNYEESIGAALIAVDQIMLAMGWDEIDPQNKDTYWDDVKKELISIGLNR